MQLFYQAILKPGDCLVYRPDGPMGWWIAFKTWTWASHVEGYAGDGQSIGARSEGVNLYPLRTDHLGYVLRPRQPFNFDQAMRWFSTVQGQKYDWLGLFCFYLARKHGAMDRMFCSELLTRWYRAGSFDAMSPWEDADHIAPAQFLQSPAFNLIWSDERSK